MVRRRRVQIHLVVGEHKADTLVLAQRFAEGGAAARVIGGDVVGAARGAEPAHAMRQPRRRKPHLGIAKPLADPAEDGTLRHPQSVDPDHRMAARHVLVERVEHPLDDNARSVQSATETSWSPLGRRRRRRSPRRDAQFKNTHTDSAQ